jgi:predicted nucleotidyltransferase
MKIDLIMKEKIQLICREHGIRILAVFGSAVSGKYRDIDFAIYLNRGIDSESMNKLKLIAELESLFSKKADIVVVHPGTPVTLLFEICRNSVLLYEDEPDSFENERSIAFRKSETDPIPGRPEETQ